MVFSRAARRQLLEGLKRSKEKLAYVLVDKNISAKKLKTSQYKKLNFGLFLTDTKINVLFINVL